MTADDPARFWDAKYALDDYFYGTEPNAWLVGQKGHLRPGMRVLAVADGEGRNSVWLAGRGLEVTAVDASPKALAKAAALAEARGVALTRIAADLRDWDWPRASFDLVVAIFAHFRPADRPLIHRRMLEALIPGGRLLLEAYSPYQRLFDTGGPKDLDMLYTAHRLEADFAAAEIIHSCETKTTLDEGSGHQGRAAVTRLIARRPRRSGEP